MRMSTVAIVLAVWGSVASAATVGDPQIKTDHAYYQGELSCSTYERVRDSSYEHLASLPGGKTPTTDTEKLVALWAWRTAHHQHADGNTTNVGVGAKHADGNGYMYARDGLVGLFSHSTGLCYAIHAQFTPFVQMMTGDWRSASTTYIPGHTSFEAYTDGKWRWADMTCGSMFFQDRTTFDALNIQDMITQGPTWCGQNDREGPLDLRLMPFGDQFSYFSSFLEEDGKVKLAGYLGMPIVYVLKGGETFTRWRTPAGDDGVQAIWSQDYISGYNTPAPPYHGMARRETFLQYAPVGQDNRGRYGSDTSSMPLVSSCKGAFVYSPDLSSPTAYKDGVWSETNATTGGGWLHGDGGAGTVVFQHGSPYQIAAHKVGGPAGNWDVVGDTCDSTAILSGTATGSVPVAVSLDNGTTWTSIGNAAGTFSLDFSQQVKGHFAYLLKLSLGDASGLSAMSLRTVVQVGPAVFPQLKSGGSVVTFSPGGLGVVYGGPEREKAATFRDASKDAAGKTAYKIVAPGPIRSLHGVASKSGANRGPVSVETSVDGVTWDVVMAPLTLEPGANRNLNSSIWGNGYLGFMWGYKRYPATASTTGWIRFLNMDTTASQQVEVYATYELPSSGNVDVTFNWTDGAGTHTDSHSFTATGASQTWNVSTGSNTVTNWVEFSCAGNAFADSDGDALDDAWETAHFGSLSHDGGADGDGDGAVDLHEYLEGTDPGSPGSVPDPGQHPGSGTISTLFREDHAGGDASGGQPDAVVDTYLDEYQPDNDGRRTSTELRVEGFQSLSDSDTALLWFDLSALPTEAVSAASLWLHYNLFDKDDGLCSAYRLTTDWAGTDGEIMPSPTTCWNSPGSGASWVAAGALSDYAAAGAASGAYATSVPADLAASLGGTSGDWCRFDVTAIVTTWQGGTANYGFIVKLPDISASKHTLFDSSNAATVNLRPILYVETGSMAPNTAPVIAGSTFSYTAAGLQASFSLSATDGDADALAYAWDFDLSDGADFADSTAEDPVHAFAANGTYLVAVRVSDGYGGGDYAVAAVDLTLDDLDGDGMSDSWETTYFGDLTHDGSADGDGDGAPDLLEYLAGTDPTIDDFDDTTDTDGDGLGDIWEFDAFGDLDATATQDPDGDDAPNILEYQADTDPTNGADFTAATDTDTDGMPDIWEYGYFGDLDEAGGDDFDADGLDNNVEDDRDTDPTDNDTDGDGLLDGVETDTGVYVDETDTGTDPTDVDTDGDGSSDGVEVTEGYDPHDPDDHPEPEATTGVLSCSPRQGGSTLALLWLAALLAASCRFARRRGVLMSKR